MIIRYTKVVTHDVYIRLIFEDQYHIRLRCLGPRIKCDTLSLLGLQLRPGQPRSQPDHNRFPALGLWKLQRWQIDVDCSWKPTNEPRRCLVPTAKQEQWKKRHLEIGSSIDAMIKDDQSTRAQPKRVPLLSGGFLKG